MYALTATAVNAEGYGEVLGYRRHDRKPPTGLNGHTAASATPAFPGWLNPLLDYRSVSFGPDDADGANDVIVHGTAGGYGVLVAQSVEDAVVVPLAVG